MQRKGKNGSLKAGKENPWPLFSFPSTSGIFIVVSVAGRHRKNKIYRHFLLDLVLEEKGKLFGKIMYPKVYLLFFRFKNIHSGLRKLTSSHSCLLLCWRCKEKMLL